LKAAGHQPRLQGLDALRGLLMVAVIIGHCPTSARGANPFGPLPEWIYFFHIPLFLALSCLFVKPFTLRRQGRRALQILVPYGLWCALEHPRQLLEHPLALLGNAAMGNWSHLGSILWFLPALFTTNLLLALWRREQLAGPRRRVLANAAAGLLGAGAFVLAPRLAPWHGRIPFGVDVALFLLPFLWGMDLVWRHRTALAERCGPWLVPAAMAALPLGGLALRTFESVKVHGGFARRVDFAQFSVPETLPGYVGLFLMGSALLILATRAPRLPWLASIGRYSMPIYLLHYPLLFAATRTIGWAGEGRGWLFLYGAGATTLVIAVAMLTARILTELTPHAALFGLQGPR
jgi:fucose 4-O-acetylase-like acetyltransferase